MAKLLTEGLVEEIRARGPLPVWRRDDDGPRTLRITKKGLQAIRVEDAPTEAGADEPNDEPTAQRANQRKAGKSSSAPGKWPTMTEPNLSGHEQTPSRPA